MKHIAEDRKCQYPKCGRTFGRSFQGSRMEAWTEYLNRKYCCNEHAKLDIKKRKNLKSSHVCLHCGEQIVPKLVKNKGKLFEEPYSIFNRRRFCDRSCWKLYIDETPHAMRQLMRFRRKGPFCRSKKSQRKARCGLHATYKCHKCYWHHKRDCKDKDCGR
jgi:hypothetical protein